MEDSPSDLNLWLLNDIIIPNVTPSSMNAIINIFRLFGIMIICSGIIVHIIIVPNIIGDILIMKIGVLDMFIEWFIKSGFDFIVILFDSFIIRNEYEAVIPIEIIINNVKMHFNFIEIIFSMIISLDINPDVKGRPINAVFVIPNVDEIKGVFDGFIFIIRMSWNDDSWIITPAHKNINDLKNAWIIIWK